MRSHLVLVAIALLAIATSSTPISAGVTNSDDTHLHRRSHGKAFSIRNRRQNQPTADELSSATPASSSSGSGEKNGMQDVDSTSSTDDEESNDATTGSTGSSGDRKKTSDADTDSTDSSANSEKKSSGGTATAPTGKANKKNSTVSAASGQDDDKEMPTSGSKTGTAASSGGKATTPGTQNATASANVTDPNAPTIDFLLSNYWNSTYFLAQSNPRIKFVPDGNFSEASQNSTATTPLIMGIEVVERRQYQVMEGLGASITDASAIVLQALKANHPDAYNEILNLLWNESDEWLQKGGAGMNMMRTPIGASDFGFTEYTYDDVYDGSPDVNFTQFRIDKSPKRWAVIRDVLKINPRLRIMATPWSPPAWMKGFDNSTLRGGSIAPRYEDAFARYMVKFVQELERKERIKIDTLSLQNEPEYEPPKYPGNRMHALQQARIGPLVRKHLDAAGYRRIGLLTWDHNWDNQTYPVEVFDAAAEAFKGVAWHCYAGTPDGQEPFNQAYPQKTVWFTECTRISQFFKEPWQNLKDGFSNILTTGSSVDYGSSAVMLWNAVLQIDPDGFTTPTVPEVCKNCLAPVLVYNNSTSQDLEGEDKAALEAYKKQANDQGELPGQSAQNQQKSKREVAGKDVQSRVAQSLMAQNSQPNSRIMAAGQGGANSTNPAKMNVGAMNEGQVIPPVRSTYYRSSDFVLLAHLGHAIRPRQGSRWAQRVGVRTSEDNFASPRLRVQLFRNDLANGSSRWSLIVLQWNDHFGYNFAKFEDATLQIKFRNYVAQIVLPPGAFTMQWTAKNSIYERNPRTGQAGKGTDDVAGQSGSTIGQGGGSSAQGTLDPTASKDGGSGGSSNSGGN